MDELLVTVGPDDLATVEDHGTIWTVVGISGDGKERVLVAGDHRPMRHLIEAVHQDGETKTVSVEAWQVRSTWPVLSAQELFDRL